MKIDVEGFEAEVIAGLSQPIRALSLEFHAEYLADARRWLARLATIGDYRYQISLGESMELGAHDWLDANELECRFIEMLPDSWGDIYAQLA